jgi:hypothetical protein
VADVWFASRPPPIGCGGFREGLRGRCAPATAGQAAHLPLRLIDEAPLTPPRAAEDPLRAPSSPRSAPTPLEYVDIDMSVCAQ